MIGEVLDFIRKDLNTYLSHRLGSTGGRDMVHLSTILNPDGSLSVKEKNVILVTVVDLSENAQASSYTSRGGGMIQLDSRPVHLNLMVLFSAYFPDDRVREGLNLLTHVIGYFQSRKGINSQNSPGLPRGVQKLNYEFVNQAFHEKSHMWGLLGSKYMPSVLYKMLMLTIDERLPEDAPIITQVDTL